MSVLNKEEFMSRLKERVGDDTSDETMTFLEDITDTFNDMEARSNDANDEEWKNKYEELDKSWREKYKARFFDSETTPVVVKKEQEEDIKDDGEEKTFSDLFVEREG